MPDARPLQTLKDLAVCATGAPVAHPYGELSAVIDLGKTRSRLLVLGPQGQLVHERACGNASVRAPLGYLALDTARTQSWLRAALADLGAMAPALRHIIVTTHGAAFAALRDGHLAFPVPDYEWTGFGEPANELGDELDPFEESLSPSLPRGLNLGRQLDWLDRHPSQPLAGVDTLVPYAQYWAWWLSGVAASEVSSLGCHTLLWSPRARSFSGWAARRGWDARFAPMRKAWEVLGPIRPELATELGLPSHVDVHVGVHDSNACLARYLRGWPRMTLISSGTWVVVMAPGAPPRRLAAERDQLANVSVRGECVSTARFMGGREVARLCAGAAPSLADPHRIEALLARGLRIVPGFEDQGGPFAAHAGRLQLDGRDWTLDDWKTHLPPADRATAAACYAACMCAYLVDELGGCGPVVLEGPFAANATISSALQALLPGMEVLVSSDSVEGTARGGWLLTRWTLPAATIPEVEASRCTPALATALRDHYRGWRAALPTVGCLQS